MLQNGEGIYNNHNGNAKMNSVIGRGFDYEKSQLKNKKF